MPNIDFDTLRVGQIVQIGYFRSWSYNCNRYFERQPLRVLRKVILRRKRSYDWEGSRPWEMIEVQSISYPSEVKLVFADQLQEPPLLELILAKWESSDSKVRHRNRYLTMWMDALRGTIELNWMDTWLPPPPIVRYKPRRTSEEVRHDKSTKMWRKMILSKGR